MRPTYFCLAAVPALLWLLGLRYLARLDPWGARGAAAPVLIPIIACSALLGLLGLWLIVRARRRREPVAALGVATVAASIVALFYLVRGVA